MTRMIDVMVKKKYLDRLIHDKDRRRYKLDITSKGKEALAKLPAVILSNRKKALAGLSQEELIQLEKTLSKILSNLN